MIIEFSVKGYRSLQDIDIRLNNLNVITGPNGSGKSSLYNALYLLAKSAEGYLAKTLALEGGMPSILWAGARKPTLTKKPVRMILSVRTDVFSYEIELGLSVVSLSLFGLDPQVKKETLWYGKEKRKSTTYLDPELSQLREMMRSWRFYHHFRTDIDSPLRRTSSRHSNSCAQ